MYVCVSVCLRRTAQEHAAGPARHFGIVYMDASTGRISMGRLEDDEVLTNLDSLLFLLRPKEVLFASVRAACESPWTAQCLTRRCMVWWALHCGLCLCLYFVCSVSACISDACRQGQISARTLRLLKRNASYMLTSRTPSADYFSRSSTLRAFDTAGYFPSACFPDHEIVLF